MLCSRCSKPLLPIIALDVDGTLGRYHEHFTTFASGYLQRPLPMGYRGEQKFWQYLGLGLEEYRQIKLAYRQGGLKRTMPPQRDLFYFQQWLRETRGAMEIWIATTRPYLRLDNIDPDTRFWLDHYGIPYDGLIYGDDKYHQLRRLVAPERVVAVLDDEPEQYDIANALFNYEAMLMRGPANDYLLHPNGVVSSLHEAIHVMESRRREWSEQHVES